MSGSRTPSNPAATSHSDPTTGNDTASPTYEPAKPSWKEDSLGDDRRGVRKNIFWWR